MGHLKFLRETERLDMLDIEQTTSLKEFTYFNIRLCYVPLDDVISLGS